MRLRTHTQQMNKTFRWWYLMHLIFPDPTLIYYGVGDQFMHWILIDLLPFLRTFSPHMMRIKKRQINLDSSAHKKVNRHYFSPYPIDRVVLVSVCACICVCCCFLLLHSLFCSTFLSWWSSLQTFPVKCRAFCSVTMNGNFCSSSKHSRRRFNEATSYHTPYNA